MPSGDAASLKLLRLGAAAMLPLAFVLGTCWCTLAKSGVSSSSERQSLAAAGSFFGLWLCAGASPRASRGSCRELSGLTHSLLGVWCGRGSLVLSRGLGGGLGPASSSSSLCRLLFTELMGDGTSHFSRVWLDT